MGSATSSLWVTGALAICAAAVIHGAALLKHGPWHYLKSYYPHIDAPMGMGVVIGFFIMGMEIVGYGSKTFVLAVRLFSNMFAGHTLLACGRCVIVASQGAPLCCYSPMNLCRVSVVVSVK